MLGHNPGDDFHLAHYHESREYFHRLALARGLTGEANQTLAREAKAIVHIDGGMHSSEVAGAQQSILLAYKLVATVGDPGIDAILDNVIVML